MDTELLPFRLKTKRKKRRLLIEDRDKHLIRLEKEYEKLNKLKNELPYVPLAEPYQRGWKRLYILRPDVAKSENAPLYQDILNKLSEVQYHYDRSFKQPKRKGRWHRYYFDRLPRLKCISINSWNAHWYKLTDKQMSLFKKVKLWDEKDFRWHDWYEFDRPELFIIAVVPHIIYEVKLHDAGLEQQLAFIDDNLYKQPYIHRHLKIKGGRYKNWYSKSFPEKKKYINPLKNTPLYKVLEEYSLI